MRLRLEYTKDTSPKFWQIERRGRIILVRWGRQGTDGASKTTKHESLDAALRMYRRVVREKLGKGYEVEGPRGARQKSKAKSSAKRAVGLSRETILDALDSAQREDDALTIAGLDWQYGGARLHAFSDGKRRWALVLEELTYPLSPSSGRKPQDTIYVVLHCIGNAVRGTKRRRFLRPVSSADDNAIFYDDERTDVSFLAQRLRPETKRINVRERAIPVPHDAASYKACGLRRLRAFPAILKFEVLVWLVERHRDLVFATEKELRSCVRADVREVLRLDEWFHPNLFDYVPSATPTFAMVADVMATGSAVHWKPKRRPNTHWSKQRD